MSRQNGKGGNSADSADRQTVEVRLRLPSEMALKLGIAAQIRGSTPSEIVAIAIWPMLLFDLPELPDVEIRALPQEEGRPERLAALPEYRPGGKAGAA